MLKHHFLLLYRNARRFKTTFLINLLGLSTGMTCVFLIYLWVNDELNVDKFNENEAQLFHIMQNLQEENVINTGEGTPGPLAAALAEEIPEVAYATSLFVPDDAWAGNGIVSFADKRLKVIAQF